MGVRVVGVGSYVPDPVITNDHLFAQFGFDSNWIVKRTGIYERRHARPDQATSDLAAEAVRRCIDRAGVDPGDIDLLLCGTFTPDYSVEFLQTNPWIHQPFEVYDSLRPGELKARLAA